MTRHQIQPSYIKIIEKNIEAQIDDYIYPWDIISFKKISIAHAHTYVGGLVKRSAFQSINYYMAQFKHKTMFPCSNCGSNANGACSECGILCKKCSCTYFIDEDDSRQGVQTFDDAVPMLLYLKYIIMLFLC